MKGVLSSISRSSGQNGRILGAYIEVQDRFPAMLAYAKRRVEENRNPKRSPYNLFTNSCVHFMRAVVEAAGVQTPTMVDPRPNSYIEELRDDHPSLDFSHASLTISGS